MQILDTRHINGVKKVDQTTEDIAIDPALSKQILQQQFGLPDFRSGQREVIDRLLARKNVAAVFPTGGGKSLCYQLPSQIFDGTTVVVSPLIALMKDQCDALKEKGIAAARLDSSLSTEEFRASMTGIRDGSIKLLYVRPSDSLTNGSWRQLEP